VGLAAGDFLAARDAATCLRLVRDAIALATLLRVEPQGYSPPMHT